jgi:hypothetical protein
MHGMPRGAHIDPVNDDTTGIETGCVNELPLLARHLVERAAGNPLPRHTPPRAPAGAPSWPDPGRPQSTARLWCAVDQVRTLMCPGWCMGAPGRWVSDSGRPPPSVMELVTVW